MRDGGAQGVFATPTDGLNSPGLAQRLQDWLVPLAHLRCDTYEHHQKFSDRISWDCT